MSDRSGDSRDQGHLPFSPFIDKGFWYLEEGSGRKWRLGCTEVDLGMDPRLGEGHISTALYPTQGIEGFASHFTKSTTHCSPQAPLNY